MNQVGWIRARLVRALLVTLAATLTATLTIGCAATPPVVDEPGSPPLDQAGRGAALYAEACASCHGENGEGAEQQVALIGPKALPVEPRPTAKARKGRLASAQDLFLFVKSDMPALTPGTLDDAQAWSLTAFLLKANGTDLHGKDLGPAGADKLAIHP